MHAFVTLIQSQSGSDDKLLCCIKFWMSLRRGMFSWWLPSGEENYTRVDSSDGKEDEEASPVRYDRRMLKIVEAPLDLGTIFLVCMIIAASAGTLGFFAGRNLPPVFPSDFLPGDSLHSGLYIESHWHICQQPLLVQSIRPGNTIEPFLIRLLQPMRRPGCPYSQVSYIIIWET